MSLYSDLIRETERTLGKRFKEHTDGKHPNSVVQEYINLTSHPVTFDHAKMLYKEDKTRRRLKEATVWRSTMMDQH